MSKVCSDGFGEIVYRDMGRRMESCRLDTVEAVASKEDAKGVVEGRIKAKQEEKSNE